MIPVEKVFRWPRMSPTSLLFGNLLTRFAETSFSTGIGFEGFLQVLLFEVLP